MNARWTLMAMMGWLLACGGVMGELPMEIPGPDGGEDGDEADEADEKEPEPSEKAALPDIEPDDGEREDDCQPESYEDFDPLLTAKQARGGTVDVDAGPNRIIETVVMDNGMQVRVERGGCTHTGEVWMVSPPPKGPLVKAAFKVLKNVETEQDPSVLDCLKDAPDPPPSAGWGSDVANCTIESKDGVLTFTFDFAL